jgi:hypothetical protein
MLGKLRFADYPGVRAIQKEHEFLWLVSTLLRNQVSSLLSIGLYQGGVEWHISRLYRERNRDIAITGIDIDNSPQLQKNLAEIGLVWDQSFKFLQQSSHADCSKLGYFDAVWIDGDHSYECVKQDFELALTHATKIIAFHDIIDSAYHRRMGCLVSKLWAEIKKSGLRTEEIVGPDWAGIGIVYLEAGTG